MYAIFGIYALPLAAFVGGLLTTLVLYRVGTQGGQTSVATMLLAGIALGAHDHGIYRHPDLHG